LLVPTDRTNASDRAYMLGFGSGITFPEAVTLGPVTSLGLPSISGQNAHVAIDIPTTAAGSFDFSGSGDTFTVCMPGSASLFGVSSASSIIIQTSTDGVNWSVDSTATNPVFLSNDIFCFDTNHLSSFAATTAVAVVTSSSGGGGGGGGRSSKDDEEEDVTSITETGSSLLTQLLPFILQLASSSSEQTCTPSTGAVLRTGARGTAVSDLQSRLGAAGFSVGIIDGIYGGQTSSALRNYQQSRGITQTGELGPLTYRSLYGSDPATSCSGTAGGTDKKALLLALIQLILANQ
jgi:hypothetical protein